MAGKTITVVNNTDTNYSCVLLFKEIAVNPGDLWKDTFPAAWKVFNVTKGGNAVQRNFNPEFYASLYEAETGNLVQSADTRKIKLGEITKGSKTDFIQFDSAPNETGGDTSTIVVSNTGDEALDIGLMDGSKNPMVVRRQVKGGESAAFVPKFELYAYLERGFIDGVVVKSEIRAPTTHVSLDKAGKGVVFTISGNTGKVELNVAIV
eukprot:TRINITY_DN3374_c0_g1_i1.p1 TRINITY_DN3374_c0_g1~~TRINITY_DN3374_c0_g1_i1.p1  ORF type:complete len:221 (-),score=37.93 TRINITY_DN3374_c0_g1_i1:165-785(-)